MVVWGKKVKVVHLCPTPCNSYSPWNSLGQNTGVGSLSLLQGILPIQGSNPGLPHCRQILYHLDHLGSPVFSAEWTGPTSREQITSRAQRHSRSTDCSWKTWKRVLGSNLFLEGLLLFAESCPTLCDPLDSNSPSFPGLHSSWLKQWVSVTEHIKN